MILIFSEKIHVARVIIQNFVFGPPVKKVAHASSKPTLNNKILRIKKILLDKSYPKTSSTLRSLRNSVSSPPVSDLTLKIFLFTLRVCG